MEYVKAKKYLIKPEVRKDICKSVRENFDSRMATRIVRYITTNKALTFSRWLKYFDYDLLEDILIEEDNVEIIKDLGI